MSSRAPSSVNKPSPLNKSGITVVVAGNTYTLRSDDPQGMRDMPAGDRDQLIALLEALKAQRDRTQRVAQAAVARVVAGNATPGAIGAGTGAPVQSRQQMQSQPQTQPGERLGKGDVDAIMARLIMEERQQRKPGLKPSTIYKIAAGVIVVIAVLSII